jgi:hypothetical protein
MLCDALASGISDTHERNRASKIKLLGFLKCYALAFCPMEERDREIEW